MASLSYSQADIDKANRYLSNYSTIKNPTEAQKNTYKQIESTYSRQGIAGGQVNIGNATGTVQGLFAKANPNAGIATGGIVKMPTPAATGGIVKTPATPATPPATGTTPTTPTAPPVTTPTTPATPTFNENAFRTDYMNQQQAYLDQIYQKQKEAQLAQMKASREKAIGEINQQKSVVAPEYQQKRNQADVVNAQSAQRLSEAMASNGLSASGENVTASVGLSSARQNALNSLNLQEQQTMNDFERRISDLNNPAEENAMMAALEAERSRSTMDAFNRATDMGYQRSRDAVGDARYDNEWKYRTDRDKVSDGRYDKEWDYKVGRDKIGDDRYSSEWNYQVGRDKRRDAEWESETKYNRGIDNRNFEYQKGRDAKTDAQWESQQKYQRGLDTKDRAWREYTYNNMSAAEKAQLTWDKQRYGEDAAWRMYEMEYNGELQNSMNSSTADLYRNAGTGSLAGIP